MGNYVRRNNKKLIVTADDFGIAPGVNQAIVRAYREGIVTSASLMVNGFAFESAVTLAKNNPGLDVGLHLNLTDDPMAFALRSIGGKVTDSDLERRIRSQIETVLSAGVQLTHIDGHKHVHVVPQVLRMICRVAPDYGIRSVRAVVERVPALGSLVQSSGRAVLKQYLFGKAASGMWRLSKCALMVADTFYGITQTGFLDFAALTGIIRDLRPGVSEMMCHPGYVDDDLRKTPTRLLAQRELELELLTRREVRKLIEECGVELISYKDLVGVESKGVNEIALKPSPFGRGQGRGATG
jgi:predicted glycoside hydrolase/deacetylase ChbG (UPF0249 family)